MNRQEFKEQYKNAEPLSNEELTRIIDKGLHYMDARPSVNYHGSKSILIAVEEMHELSQEITHLMAGTDTIQTNDYTGLLEEMSDVWSSNQMICRALGIEPPKIPIDCVTKVPLPQCQLIVQQTKLLNDLAVMGQLLIKVLRKRPDEDMKCSIRATIIKIHVHMMTIMSSYGFDYQMLMKATAVKMLRMDKRTEPDSAYV